MVAESDPTYLPLLPSKSAYSYKKNSGVVSVALEGGKSKKRLDLIGGTSQVSCEWFLTRSEYDFFMAFYVGVAKKGAAAFYTSLILDNADPQQYECSFVPDTLVVNSPGSTAFFISADLEVTPLVEPSEFDALQARRAAGLPSPEYFERYYEFGGSDDVQHPVIQLTADYTIAMWYYTDADTNFALCGSFDKDVDSTHEGEFRRATTQWLLRHDGHVSGLTYTAAAPTLSEWHHVACVRNNTSIKLYIDGVEVLDAVDAVIEDLHLRCFGRAYLTSTSYRLAGRMKEYQIYKDRALTAAEITYLHTNGVSGSDPGTVGLEARFRMDEAEGVIAYDSSGNGNHGDITALDINTFHGSE